MSGTGEEGARALRRDAERNRRRVLAAARGLFAQRGLAVTHHDVARAAEVGVGTVYRRFPTREDLLAALFDDQVERVGQLAEEALDAADPWTGLTGFLTAVCELQAADRGLQEHMGTASAPSRAGQARQRIAPVVGELVTRCRQRGQVRPEVTVQDVALLPVMVGAVTDRARDVAPELWRRVLGLLLAGLRPAAEPLPGVPLTAEESDRVLGSARPPRRPRATPSD